MPIELYLSREFETAHEMQALGDFLKRMLQVYGKDDNTYFVFANFFCQGEEIDFAVLKRDAVIVVELKDVGGPLSGGENGPWTGTHPDGSVWTVNDRRRRNPYQQVRDYRFAVMKQLKEDVPLLMPRERFTQQRLDHVSGVVTLCPNKHQDTNITVPKSRWFQVVGLDELPQMVYFLRSPAIDFRASEIRKLAEIWNLSPTPLDRFVPTVPTDGLVPVQNEPAQTLSSQQPAASVKTTAPAPSPDTKSPEPTAGADLESAPLEERPCPVCMYLDDPCQVPFLAGIVEDAGLMDHPTQRIGVLTLRTSPETAVTLALTEPWSNLISGIDRVLQEPSEQNGNQDLELAAYHLSKGSEDVYVAGPDSLVVLEPDWLINVTDLTKVEYCPRQYLADRFQFARPNHYMIRGNIVHRVFERIVKNPADAGAVAAALEPSIRANAQDLAVLNLTVGDIWQEVSPHCTRLLLWGRSTSLPAGGHSETFLLTPHLGMKGKIDAVWADSKGNSFIIELKTGRSQGAAVKPGHGLQVTAYSLMTGVTQLDNDGEIAAMILYTGNDQLARSLNIERLVPLDPQSFQSVVNERNRLVLTDYLVDAPFEMQYPNKCLKCQIGHFCKQLAVLLDHSDTRHPQVLRRFAESVNYSGLEQTWFRTYTALLMAEYRKVKEQHAALWRMPPEARSAAGSAVIISGVVDQPENGESDTFVYNFTADNQSELREDDFVLVSDESGPLGGVIAQGEIRSARETGLSVEFHEPLEFEPRFVDKYTSETLLERQFASLFAWLNIDSDRRDVVLKNQPPHFRNPPIEPHFPPVVGLTRLNGRQQQAVKQALNMENYLIIHGPPGSGKTTLIAAIVREYLHQGKRVLLAAGTNTAVDNMLKALVDAGLRDQLLRLGGVHRIDPVLRDLTLQTLAHDEDLDAYIANLRQVLTGRPVVATTTTGWMNGMWDDLYEFDVAILDEAAQLTVPHTLSPLRLANSFILIGDHMQLPAVVLSESGRHSTDPEAADGATRLSTPLFKQLYTHLKTNGIPGIVKLNEQYRMNDAICAIPRELWYEQDLQPADKRTAHARLAVMPRIPHSAALFPILDPEQPVIFVDIPWVLGAGAPRTNRAEAELVRDIVVEYLDHGVAYSSIGIIAPFRAQVSTIRRALEARLPDNPVEIRAMVDTVDRFQGQQRELIIISLATHGDFVHDLLQDERRLNVALTRAKHKLIILGDATVLRSHPAFFSLIHHCTVVRPPSATDH